ncbi:MAG: 50S ribosomal protein L20 [Candidatus Aureabacteria bacterium]|nr:50S ribosomal protein L20 [Candidatus Auribacterota bacterium]MCK5160106.1 50S ribosomal protein L20 [Candidatus Auribacterota bacterium]MCK5656067.1 50S ribosomal protein L20 [Candidatus Auribacterota bacterium]
MPRATNAPATKKRHKRVLKRAKGFVGGRSKLFRTANESVKRARKFAFRDRKVKKRQFRSLWIVRISAAVKQAGLSYSKFIDGLTKAGVELDRKILSDIAVSDEKTFKEIVETAKSSLK